MLRMIHSTQKMGFVACLAGLVAIPTAQATVSLISVEHRVWGTAGDSPSDEYFHSSSSPVSGAATGTKDFDAFTEYYQAQSSATTWSLEASRTGDAFRANAYAKNTYLFRPSSDSITIRLDGAIGNSWRENQAKMELTNVTTSILVSSYYSPSYTLTNPFQEGESEEQDFLFEWQTVVVVNPAHVYELVIFVGAQRDEGGVGSASLTLKIPEPASPLLAGMAAFLYCLQRQRLKG